MKPTLLIFSALCAWAQSGIEIPSIGSIVDPAGALISVHGVAGNFLLGPVAMTDVLSAACWEQLCLAKTDSKIVSATGDVDAPAGPAVFGLGGSVIFFPESRTFARWHDSTLDPLDWTVEGEVLSIRGSNIAVRREGRVWIVRPDGGVVDWVADTAGPVLLLEKGVLLATADHLVLRQYGSETRFEVSGVEAITAMGPHYAAIRAGGATYALRTDLGREELYPLPGNSP